MLKNIPIALLVALVVTACAVELPSDAGTDDDDAPAGTGAGEVVIHEDVVILDADPCLLSVDVPEDRETLVFEFSCDPALSGIEIGSIVVGTDGGGYLRRVVAMEIDGPIITAVTEPASLNEAVIQGDMHVSMGESERALIDLGNTTLYGDELFGSFTLFRLQEASLDITPLLDIDGHWGDGRIETFEMDASLRLAGALSVLLSTTNGLRYADSFPVWEGSLPFSTAIGPLPVVGQLGIKTSIGYMVDAPGHMSATAGGRGELGWETSHQYKADEGWTNHRDYEDDWLLDPPTFEVSTSAKAKFFVRTELFMQMYGVAGPEIRSDLYTLGSAGPSCNGIDWDLKAGLTARASVRLNIMDKFTPTKTFATVDFTADLAAGQIPWPIGVPIPCAQEEITCGEIVEDDTSSGVYQPQLNGYSCNVGNYDAPEAIFKYVAKASGPTTWSLVDPVPTDVNHDVMVVDGAFRLVTGDCSDFGHNSVEFEAVEGRTYYLIVDGYDEDAGPFGARLECLSTDSASDDDPLGDTDPF